LWHETKVSRVLKPVGLLEDGLKSLAIVACLTAMVAMSDDVDVQEEFGLDSGMLVLVLRS
jgi:hypothetical protein